MSSASRLTSPFFNDHQWSQETASTNDSSQSSLFSQASQPSTQPSRASSLLEPDLEADLEQEQQDDIDDDSPEGWIAYLSAQYQTHIVDNLKQTMFEKIDQLKASVASLQQNHARQEQASAVSVGELRATHDQIFNILRDLKPIPSRLSALERDVRQNKEQAGHALSDLDDKVESLKTDLGIKHDGVMKGLKSVQQQSQSFLETLETLQREIRILEQQQAQTNGRLSSFQSQLEKTLAPRQELPGETIDFLKQLFGRRADLMELMESPTTATRGAYMPVLEAALQANLPWRSPQNTRNQRRQAELVKAAPKIKATQKRKALPPAPAPAGLEPPAKRRANQKRGKVDLPLLILSQKPLDSTKRLPPAKARKELPAPEKRPSATTKQPDTTKQKAPVVDTGFPPSMTRVQDMKLLFKQYNDEYKARPPKAEYLFVSKFINNIESPEKLIHLQTRLLELLPDHISRRRAAHCVGDRFIQVSKSLTWGRFAMALAEV